MKKRKIAIISILALGIIVLVAYIATEFSTGPQYIIPASSVEYQTKEELTDLYWQNKTVLNAVKNSVLSNKGFLQVLIDQKDGDAGILTEVNKDLFTDEEWENIVSVFENLHPYMIMVERKGRPVRFYINFDSLQLDTGSKRTSLYWFTDKEEIEYQKEHSLADSVEYTHLDGNWY
ncbi:MAG: hypothetical protein PHW41_00950, partial [Eubacteriales bacterium]|nr:hypothetical protein [Eubacteriales bacterium]